MKHFHLGAISGALAGAAAGSVVFAWRNSSLNVQHIRKVRFIASVAVPPTTQQVLALQMALATFGDDYTDGQNLSDPATAANYAVRNTNLDKLRVLASAWRPVSSLASGNVRIANAAALTPGASPPTIDVHGYAWNGFLTAAPAELAQRSNVVLEWSAATNSVESQHPEYGCIPLEQNRGFIVRPTVALGAALVLTLSAEVDWIET